MSLHCSELPQAVQELIREGTIIPAHPLALNAQREFDGRRQRALTHYYVDSGVGGLAVGVHTTQFEIRDVGLYEPVLRLAASTARELTSRPLVLVAGICGRTEQAVQEAALAVSLGYHAGLLSLAALKGASEDDIIAHCEAVARVMPLVGFYLQPSVGGIPLSVDFWRRFALIDNVIAIKVAPFNRYHTLDVLHGVAAARAEDKVTLFTGNDDHILLDLTVPFDIRCDGRTTRLRFKGGLLGHWSVWTSTAVRIFERCRLASRSDVVDADLLALDARITDCNAAFFDVHNGFRGCIAGCHEVLRRQGLLATNACLNPEEGLSPGQREEIDRVLEQHADLSDDDFVAQNLQRWLACMPNPSSACRT